MPFNLKLHLPNVAALCFVSSFFLLTAWTRPGYDSPRRRRLVGVASRHQQLAQPPPPPPRSGALPREEAYSE